MRVKLLTLTGFVALILCPSLCPMNMGTMAEAHSTTHAMHMAHHDMQHEDEAVPCEHCEVRSEDELALTSVAAVIDAPAIATTPAAPKTIRLAEHIDISIPRSRLAAAGPPLAPNIVSTIVLRT